MVYHRDIPSPGNLQDALLPHRLFRGRRSSQGISIRGYRQRIYIEVRAYTQDLDPDDYDREHNRFRYVLIPGAEEILSTKAQDNTFSVDFNDHGEVKKYFGIEEEDAERIISD